MSRPTYDKFSEFDCTPSILQSIAEFTNDLDNFTNGKRKPNFTKITDKEKVILVRDLNAIEGEVNEIKRLIGK